MPQLPSVDRPAHHDWDGGRAAARAEPSARAEGVAAMRAKPGAANAGRHGRSTRRRSTRRRRRRRRRAGRRGCRPPVGLGAAERATAAEEEGRGEGEKRHGEEGSEEEPREGDDRERVRSGEDHGHEAEPAWQKLPSRTIVHAAGPPESGT